MNQLFNTMTSGLSRLLVSILFLTVSCKKLIEINPPASQLTTDKVFVDDKTATAVVAAIYGGLSSNYYLASYPTLTAGCTSDELVDFSTGLLDFNNNAIQTNNASNGGIWHYIYNTIYQANALLEGLQASKGVSNAVKVQLSAEAKFIRAFCYFELVNLYGDVPLVTTTDVTVSAKMPRTGKDQVYQQIISDLKDAQRDLNDSYITTEKVRANKSAATALLARTYLYMRNWQEAEAQATTVIDNPLYALNGDLDSVFLKNSAEAILQIWTINGYTDLGNTLVPGSINPNMYFTPDYINAMEMGDRRSINWVGSIVYGGTTYYYPWKYKINSSNSTGKVEYLMVLRLSEQYLIRAEARAQQNNTVGAETDLNVIRNRAGLANMTASTQVELLLAIEKERRIELAAEWGHRWFDLKRTGRADAVLGAVKPLSWKPSAALYPIPLVEINANPALTQNPGYN